MIDIDTPVPKLTLCPHGHVACLQAEALDGRVWCWGWHLVAWDPEWRYLVADASHFASCVEQLATLLVGAEVDLTTCTFTWWITDG